MDQMSDKEMVKSKKETEGSLIINRPEAINSLRRGAELSFTTFGWAVWFIFLRPLVLLLLWYLGFKLYYRHMVYLGGFDALVNMSAFYVSVIFAIYLVIRGWNIYNFLRFGSLQRRKHVNNVSNSELEDFFKFNAGSIQKISQWEEIKVSFSAEETVILADAKSKSQETVIGKLIPG